VGKGGKIRFLFHEDALVSPLVEVPHTPVPAIEIAGVGDVEVAHEFGEIGYLSFHQQMEMVGHKDIGVEFY